MRAALILIAALALAGPAIADGVGPRLKVVKLEQLPTPLPKPYDEKATPAQVEAAIDAAFARAKAGGKNVIVDLGGNWCSWCRSLAGVLKLPEAKPFVDANFEVVMVNISSAQGLTDRNNQVLRRFKIAKVDGVPWLIVAAPDGRILASSSAVTDKSHETPQAMINWIAAYAPQSTPKKAKS